MVSMICMQNDGSGGDDEEEEDYYDRVCLE